jgi:hypothetical protein
VIQQTIDVLSDAIDANLVVMLAEMPGALSQALPRVGDVVVSRHVLTEDEYAKNPIGVRVEMQDAVTETWPFEAVEEIPQLSVGVTCWLYRPRMRTETMATDMEMVAHVRTLARAVSASLRRAFRDVAALDRDGVQIRCPASVTYGEPEMGDDGALVIMTLSLSVPVLDYWALAPGGV